MAMTKINSSERNDSWNAKEDNRQVGDKLHGFYVEKKNINTKKGAATIYVIHADDDKKYDLWGSAVITSAFDQIKLGAEVEIEYLGMAESKSGNDFHNYEIAADNEHPNTANFN